MSPEVWTKNLQNQLNSLDEYSATTIYYPKTQKALFVSYPDRQITLESYGRCETCKTHYHQDCLYFHPGVVHNSWPIVYVGMYCKDCASSKTETIKNDDQPNDF